MGTLCSAPLHASMKMNGLFRSSLRADEGACSEFDPQLPWAQRILCNAADYQRMEPADTSSLAERRAAPRLILGCFRSQQALPWARYFPPRIPGLTLFEMIGTGAIVLNVD